MKPKQVHLLYHSKTNTTWSNCSEWDARRKTEVIKYGEIDVDISNVFAMKREMGKDGYILVKENPFKILNGFPE